MMCGRIAGRSSATVWMPRAKAVTAIASKEKKCSNRPRTCARGRNWSMTLPRGTGTTSRAAVTSKAKLLWRIRTPLGGPVVPEV
jgi:hypothetical protein